MRSPFFQAIFFPPQEYGREENLSKQISLSPNESLQNVSLTEVI